MAELKFIVSLDSSAFKTGAKDVVAQVKQVSDEVKKEGGKMQKEFDKVGKDFGSSLKKNLAAIGGVAAFKSLIDNIVKVRGEFQKAGVAIETMLGSKEKADELMAQVKQIAASSPLEFSDITKATQQMLSFNIAAEDAPKFIKAIGDVSMGEKDRFQSLALAFSQMSATGKLMGQDLLQMINAGFNPLAEISRTTGKSISKLKDEMSKGAISAEMVQKAFISATSAGGKFFGMSEAAAQTVNGQISMMQDALANAFNEIGQKSEGLIMSSIQGITKLIQNYETVLKIIGALVANYGVYRVAVMLVTAAEEAHGMAAAFAALKQELLNKTMLANPYVLAAVALGALVTTIVAAATAESGLEKATREASEAIEDQKKKLDERKRAINELISTIQDETATEYQKIEAYEQLKKLAPDITDEYSRSALASLETAKAQKEVNKSIKDFEFDEVVANIEKYRTMLNAVESSHNQWLQINDKIKKEIREEFGNPTQPYGTKEEIEATLHKWEEELERIRQLNKKVEEEAKPIEIRIQEAEENEQTRKEILDFWDEAGKKIHELTHPNMLMTFEGSKANLDDYIKTVEKRLADLQKKLDKDPTNVNLQLKQSEGEKILGILRQMRQAWISSGNTVLPIMLKFTIGGFFEKAMQAYNNAKATYNQLVEDSKKKPAGTTDTTKEKEAHKKTTDDRARRAKEEADQFDRIFELQQEQKIEQARKSEDLEMELREAQLRGERESTQKHLKELELTKDKEVQAVKRWYEDLRQARIDEAKKLWDADKSNEGKKFYESEEYKKAASDSAYSEQEKKAFKSKMDAAILVYRNAMEDIAKAENAALVNFLREYGDYEQKRLAIAKDYASKIAEAQTLGEKLALQAQEREAYKSLDFERFKKSVNWEDVFGDLDGISAEHLRSLREQLEKTLEDGTMKASDYKAVVEQINKVDEAIVARQNEWKSALGLSINELERRKKLEQDAERAQQRVLDLTAQQEEAQKRLNSAKAAILASGIKIDFKDIKVENAEKILGQFAKDSDIYKRLERLFGGLAEAEQDLANTTDNLANANNAATNAVEKTQKTFAGTLRVVSELTNKINANVQSAKDLIDTLGLTDTSFGKGFGEFADASADVTQAISDLQNGNFAGAVNGVLSAVGNLGNALGSWGLSGFGESDRTLAKDMELLAESNDALKRSIDELTDEMEKSSVAAAAGLYEQMQHNIDHSIENTQEMLQRTAAAYNNGFLGIGGKGSGNKRINEGLNESEWQRISAIVKGSVRSAAQFWDLTSEQMYKVAKDAPDVYAHIKQLAAEGYADASQYMEDYIGYWKELEEAADAYNERVTSVSLDSIVGDFTTALADMDSNAADFAENFEQYIKNAVINALVSNEFEPLIKKWYENFVKAAETDGIDKMEQDALRKEWDDITAQGLKRREQMREMFGWGSGTSEEGGAYGAVKSFSQEQGDELNGRLTAIQIGQQRSNESLLSAVASLQNLSVVINAGHGTLNEMRNLMLIGNGHLEDIARYTRLTSQHSELLNDIANKIKTL